MPDPKKFAIAHARLQSLRGNIPSSVDERCVNEYHSIMTALQEASGDDLSSFAIPTEELKPRVIGAVLGGHRDRSSHTYYSDRRYCDRPIFARQVEALCYYIESIKKDVVSRARWNVEVEVNASSHRECQRLAVEESRKSISESDGKPRPKVGAVVVKDGTVLGKAFRGEISKCHAEYILLERKLKDAAIAGSTVYTTLEPCTKRSPPKEPCADWLVARKVARVVIGMLDPNPSILGKGVSRLRKAGIEVAFFEPEFMAEIEELNREFANYCEDQESTSIAGYQPPKARVALEKPDEHVLGKKWVEETLIHLLKGREMNLDSPLEWRADFDREIYILRAMIGGQSTSLRLSYEALEDCVADRNVGRVVEDSLRAFILPEIPKRSRGLMDIPHKQVITTYPVAIKSGQRRLHVPNPVPWHLKSGSIKCPQCEIVFIVTEGFPRDQFLEILKKQHERNEKHPDYIASAPEWTRVSECDCEKPLS